MIEILAPGPLCTIQDRGRPGWAALGVPHSGAFDRGAAALANRLVGNDADAAVLEVTLGGLQFRALRAVTIALTGAPCAGLDWGTVISLPPGAVVRLSAPVHGLRSYLGVRGGIAVEPVLGSRSTDLLGGLGPAPVQAADRLPIGRTPAAAPSGTAATPSEPRHSLRILAGPRAGWFTDAAQRALLDATWTVRAESDRRGVRLDGPELSRAQPGELPSEATLPGAVQVPAAGRPIVFGPDAPVTGGYPVIAVLSAASLDLAAQLRPGDRIRFRPARDAGSPT
jgi:biotin-dependent carboxylase-like uncharacterized protein